MILDHIGLRNLSFEQNNLRESLRGENGEKLGQGDFFLFLDSKVIKHLG